MVLHLVRHGRAEAGVEHLDPGLDEVGWQQARHAAGALAGLDARRLVVSPLRRTRETALPIAERLGLAPELREEVAEVFDPSLSPPERGALLATFLGGRWSLQPEALRIWRARVLDTLVALGATEEPVIIVSHFVAISCAVGAATGDDRVSPCPLANASITTLGVDAGRLQLRHAGDIAHLPRECITAGTLAPGRLPRPEMHADDQSRR
jgi:broad specificity phosphatase PhoE